MRKGDVALTMALALLAFAVAWAVAQEPPKAPYAPQGGVPLPDTATTMGPVIQIGNTGNVSPLSEDGKALCRDAPLGSFGPACEGYTWWNVNGSPKEMRTKRGGYPNPVAGQLFGFL